MVAVAEGTRMYNRCPLCEGWLEFYGISIKPEWVKWLYCNHDATYSGVNEYGALIVVTKKIPERAYFADFKREDRRA